MARIEFDGLGQPIPLIALPPFGSDKDLPATVLTFTENAEFSVQQYRDLGFTHFEALCVGAAGGKGGDAASEFFFAMEYFRRPVPQEIWNLHLEQTRIMSYLYNGVWDFPAVHGPQFPPQGITQQEYQEWANPNHIMNFAVVRQVVLRLSIYEATGGAGGGGGFHRVFGVLADLDASVPIVVGKAGENAPPGQTRVPYVFTPDMRTPSGDTQASSGWGANPINPRTPPFAVVGDAGAKQRWVDIMNYLDAYLTSYPDPHNSFAPPQSGGDGGTSTFASGVAQASGGQGGLPAKVYTTSFQMRGYGGDGGLGGRAEPGGGGKGSVDNKLNGSDGIWHPELGIGGGGGGGTGGHYDIYVSWPEPNLKLATAGGQGSYSYADASVYGPRQVRALYQTPSMRIKLKPKLPSDYLGDYFDSQSDALPNGEIDYNSPYNKQPPQLVIPGGGGGARPIKNLKYGSLAPGYSPNGVVVLRLTQIAE